MPPFLLHFLLSLLLLVSQQMALAHGLSHWHGTQQHQAAQLAGGQPDAPTLQEFCAECAANAQLDAALPLPIYLRHTQQSAAAGRPAHCTEAVRVQPVRGCLPRGPPRAN